MVDQSLFLCLLISALGGTLMTASNATVVHMARKRKKRKQGQQQASGKLNKVMMMCQFVFFSALAHACIFFAPWFGPVSIFWPTYMSCKLLSNMIIIGVIMGHEKIDKNIQVATMVVVAAVVYITITGPEPKDGQDIYELFLEDSPIALIWTVLLGVAYVVCIGLFVVGGMKDKSPAFKERIHFMISITSSALVTTTSKIYSLLPEGPIRTITIVISWSITVAWANFGFFEAKDVRSLATYFPKKTFGTILINALTGILVWEDQNVVQSWVGYITALCILGMGVYLLSDLDFFKVQAQEQQDFHRDVETIQDFFSSIEKDLSRARLERSMSRHQRPTESRDE